MLDDINMIMMHDKMQFLSLNTLGVTDRPRPTFISAKLDPEYKQELVKLLKEYKYCFAWEYYEMPDLDRSIVEHRLPIKPGHRPH